MAALGQKIGVLLHGGECIELVGDVGAGKTTLTKSIARALGIEGPIQSPTFTICNRYQTSNGHTLAHYDFYRLNEAGLMKEELGETLDDETTITIIEWGDIVADVLGSERITISILSTGETDRELTITARGALASFEERLT